MAEWMFDGRGQASVIYDGNKIRSASGQVIGWINGSNVSSLPGRQVGWFDGGVIYDNRNCTLMFTRGRTGSLPSSPGIGGTPGKPGFSGPPGRPGFSGTPGKPGRGGWSSHDPSEYFGV